MPATKLGRKNNLRDADIEKIKKEASEKVKNVQ